MYKHIEKDEKKLTYGELVSTECHNEQVMQLHNEIEELRKAKVIHETVDYCYEDLKNAQVEIERLSKKAVVLEVETNNQKAEIERLASLYDGKHGFMTSSIGDLPLTVEGLRKAVDEISRLLTVQTELQELNAKYYNEAKDLKRENAKIQKRVDELKFDKELLQKLIDKREKDTAKEIFTDLLKEFSIRKSCGNADIVVKEVAQRYGVEVE